MEVVMVFQWPNTNIGSVTLHGRNSGSFVPSVAAANNFLVSLAGSMATRMTTNISSSTRMMSVKVRDMTNPTLPQFVSSAASVVCGSGASAAPADVAVVLTEQLSIRGRGAKGRLYIGGLASGAISTTGQISAAAQTAFNLLGSDWMANMLAGSLTVCVAKPARQEYLGLTGALHPARAATSIDVTSIVCQNLEFDTQRRRGL